MLPRVSQNLQICKQTWVLFENLPGRGAGSARHGDFRHFLQAVCSHPGLCWGIQKGSEVGAAGGSHKRANGCLLAGVGVGLLIRPRDRRHWGTPLPGPLPCCRGEGEASPVPGVVHAGDSSVCHDCLFSRGCEDAGPVARPVGHREARRFSKERMLMILMITGVGWSFARAGTWILAMLRPALGFDWGGLMMNGSLPASRGRTRGKPSTICGAMPATPGFTPRSCSFRKSMLGSWCNYQGYVVMAAASARAVGRTVRRSVFLLANHS